MLTLCLFFKQKITEDLKALGLDSVDMLMLRDSPDCDVIQADGGTRTAAITGASVALNDALESLIANGTLKNNPMTHQIAAISVCNFNSDFTKNLFHGFFIL